MANVGDLSGLQQKRGGEIARLTMRGYFCVGIWQPKFEVNVGGVLRSAQSFGAAMVFTVGHRKYVRQATDTSKAFLHLPLMRFADIEDLIVHLPHSCVLVGVEMCPDAQPLREFVHPERACYLLGAEDAGIPLGVLVRCHRRAEITGGKWCLNVASAASIVMYDRASKNAA